MCFHAPCTKTVVPLAMGNNPCPLFNAYVGRFDLILIPLGDGIMLCHQQSLVLMLSSPTLWYSACTH